MAIKSQVAFTCVTTWSYKTAGLVSKQELRDQFGSMGTSLQTKREQEMVNGMGKLGTPKLVVGTGTDDFVLLKERAVRITCQ